MAGADEPSDPWSDIEEDKYVPGAAGTECLETMKSFGDYLSQPKSKGTKKRKKRRKPQPKMTKFFSEKQSEDGYPLKYCQVEPSEGGQLVYRPPKYGPNLKTTPKYLMPRHCTDCHLKPCITDVNSKVMNEKAAHLKVYEVKKNSYICSQVTNDLHKNYCKWMKRKFHKNAKPPKCISDWAHDATYDTDEGSEDDYSLICYPHPLFGRDNVPNRESVLDSDSEEDEIIAQAVSLPLESETDDDDDDPDGILHDLPLASLRDRQIGDPPVELLPESRSHGCTADCSPLFSAVSLFTQPPLTHAKSHAPRVSVDTSHCAKPHHHSDVESFSDDDDSVGVVPSAARLKLVKRRRTIECSSQQPSQQEEFELE